MPDQTYRISEDHARMRLDQYLTQHMGQDWTRSMIKRAIADGHVTLNARTVTKAGQKLAAGDTLTIQATLPPALHAHPQDIPLDVLYEDDHVAVINKPAGMVVHPAPGHPDGTLVNAIMHHFEHVAAGEDPVRPGIVHRIDKDTSGSLVIVKTKAAHLHMSKLFHDHDIERIYHALVLDQGLDDRGTFDTLHARDTSDRKRYSSKVHQGRRAVTHYKVLERFDQGVALVACKLETGRSHQIRVHFHDANCPLLGDTTYGGRRTGNTRVINRQALHALHLGFVDLHGNTVAVDAPYPDDFAQALQMLRQGKSWRM